MEKVRTTDMIIAFATVVIALTAIVQGYEMVSSSKDTHDLAAATVASNRAWVAPQQIILGSAIESGPPLKYQIRIVNPGKEPALGVAWNVKPFGVPYISEGDGTNNFKLGQNASCAGLEPGEVDGTVVYPTGPANFWLPLSVLSTPENVQLIDEVKKKTKSLVIEGCFVYRTGGGKHTSAFRFFLRDIPDNPSFITGKDGNSIPAWNFNIDLTGNTAD
jgi:hypothetical protein